MQRPAPTFENHVIAITRKSCNTLLQNKYDKQSLNQSAQVHPFLLALKCGQKGSRERVLTGTPTPTSNAAFMKAQKAQTSNRLVVAQSKAEAFSISEVNRQKPNRRRLNGRPEDQPGSLAIKCDTLERETEYLSSSELEADKIPNFGPCFKLGLKSHLKPYAHQMLPLGYSHDAAATMLQRKCSKRQHSGICACFEDPTHSQVRFQN